MQNKIYCAILAVAALMLSSMVGLSENKKHPIKSPNFLPTAPVGNLYIGFSFDVPANTGSTGGSKSSGLAVSAITPIEGLEGNATNSLHLDHIPIENFSINASRNLYIGSGGLTSGSGKSNGGEFVVKVNTAGKEYVGIQQKFFTSSIIPYARITVRSINNKVQEEYFLKNVRINSIGTGASDVSTGQIQYSLSMVYEAIKHVNYTYASSGNIGQVSEMMFNYNLNTATF